MPSNNSGVRMLTAVSWRCLPTANTLRHIRTWWHMPRKRASFVLALFLLSRSVGTLADGDHAGGACGAICRSESHGPLDTPSAGDAGLLYAAGRARAYCQTADGLGWLPAQPDYRHGPGASGRNRTGVYCPANAGGARETAGGGQAPGTPQRETRSAAQTRCAGGGHPRLPGQGHQQAGDREIGGVRAVHPLCVVGPAEPPTLPWSGTRPGPLGGAVSGPLSKVEEQWG